MTCSEKICRIASEITGLPAEDFSTSSPSIDLLDLTEIILDVEQEFDLIFEDDEFIKDVNDLIYQVEALTV